MTRDQALALKHGDSVHYDGGDATCKRVVGPRGGVKEFVQRWRVSGECKTWVHYSKAFRLPVKYGLKVSGAIDEGNMHHWHIAAECPLEYGTQVRAFEDLGE